MITKEQALNLKHGQVIKQVKDFNGFKYYTHPITGFKYLALNKDKVIDLDKPVNWRVNGKVKTWKTRPAEFKVPIKHGLYDYGYLDHTNNHLFELGE